MNTELLPFEKVGALYLISIQDALPCPTSAQSPVAGKYSQHHAILQSKHLLQY